MTNKFAISIPVGPIYDARLRMALQSIAEQDVDVSVALCDCSCHSEVYQLADEFSHIIDYCRHGPDDGQAAGICEGWEAINGNVLAWLNVDDRFEPNALKNVSRLFSADENIDVVYGQSYIETDGEEENFSHPAVEGISPLLFRSNIISQPSCFVREKSAIEVGGLNQNLTYTMDWDFWVRLYEAGKNFKFVSEFYSTVFWGDGTKTSALNTQRMSELWAVARRNSSRYVALKSMIGFATHHYNSYR